MTLEELKALLEAGRITQEEYDQKIKELEDDPEADKGGEGDEDKEDFDIKAFLESEDFKKLLQSEVDKVRTKYSQEKKDLEKELKSLRQSNMTKEEILEQRENDIKEYELKVNKRELDFETLKKLEEKKLSSNLLGHITGDDMEAREKQIEQLETTINELASLRSEEKFKSQGRDYKEGDHKEKNWEDMTIDERIEFAEKNPEEAEKYL